ncbi:hypothetical protein Tco_0009579 [Tanacetum coccineum]
MTRMENNWIMRKQLKPKEDLEGIRGISNFIGRIRGMHIFVGNYTYVSDFMIVEDIRIVRFANGTDEIAYKIPHKIEQFNSLTDLEKENTKSVYFRNKEDKRRGVEYMMNKILGFYKECLDLRPEYLTGLEEGDVKWTKESRLHLMRKSQEFLGVSCGRFLDDDLDSLSFVSSLLLSKTKGVLKFGAPSNNGPVHWLMLPFLYLGLNLEGLVSNFMASQDARLSKFEADFKQQQGEMTNKIDTFLKAINDRMTGALPSDTVKNPKLNVNSTSLVLSGRSYPMEDPQCSSRPLNLINAIKNSSSPKRVHFINKLTIISKEDEPRETWTVKPDTRDNDHGITVEVEEESEESEKEEEEEEDEPECTNSPSPSNPSISFIIEKVCKLNSFLESLNLVYLSSNTQFVCTKENDEDIMFVGIIKKYDDSRRELERAWKRGSLSNLKIPCNIGHVHVEKAYIDLNSPINIMTRMENNWIMRKQLKPKEDLEGIRGISNFIGRIRGMHIFVGNYTYVSDFMIVEDISLIIDPRLSQVVLGKPFVEISNMSHDLSLGIVRFANGIDEIAYKMPHKIEQFNSLTDLEKENTKSVYFRNKEDKRRGVEYMMNKILGFYKECLDLRPEYLTGLEEGEVTFDEEKPGVLRSFMRTILG